MIKPLLKVTCSFLKIYHAWLSLVTVTFTLPPALLTTSFVERLRCIDTLIFKVKILCRSKTYIFREQVVIHSYTTLVLTITLFLYKTCYISFTTIIITQATCLYGRQSTVRCSLDHHVLIFRTVGILYHISMTCYWTLDKTKRLHAVNKIVYMLQ
jgi:hypothetical protein